jgi:biopolymer transport protein ExbD
MVYAHKKKLVESPKLDMTPMIDVVFQLLIFFVVTLKQEDILSKLVASRPSTSPTVDVNQIEQQAIVVSAQGFTFGGRVMRLEELDVVLRRRATYQKDAMLLIKCTKDSPHAFLVQALDVCNKHDLSNLSILSL